MNYFNNTNILYGYAFTIGHYEYFIITSYKRITKQVIKSCMAIRLKHVCKTDDINDTLNRCFNDVTTYIAFKKLLQPATISKKQLSNGDYYYTIQGKNFTANYPENDFVNCVVINRL